MAQVCLARSSRKLCRLKASLPSASPRPGRLVPGLHERRKCDTSHEAVESPIDLQSPLTMNTTFLPCIINAAISLTLAGSAMAAGSAKPATQNRAEIAAEFRWDFTPIYANWAAWEAGMKEIETRIDALSLIHISEPTRRTPISYAVFCLK